MKEELSTTVAESNITEFPYKSIKALHRPQSLEQLRQLLEVSRQNKTPLHFASTGKNWGLGSKQAVVPDAQVVVLDQLDEIIEVNEKYRYAIIEPGVTQKQLSDYLLAHHPHLRFHVTGSAENTSIVGNMLERGVGFAGHRNKMLVGMEVMLASGKLIRTGFWHYFQESNPLAFHYPAGHGPDLRGLFSQSNLAITTKMVVRLQLNKETQIFEARFVFLVADYPNFCRFCFNIGFNKLLPDMYYLAHK